ncbi:polyketide synthase [Streptomyces sp. MUSC 14]|uniref:SDR family NAD(P)-dependent oxidoreductase n=1 Tax=Streptomyces sp. MUSC 14 TaxID=1354889 RepID=UPI0008F5617F|nr:SDR family oxidoreductase [Streptomyces sp. MUSC 14]OIJ94684.1 polyketide synthase [Streptomyces sp. MUSC 14]
MSEERVALITGSSTGIGAAVARRMAAAGLRVVVNSASSVKAGEELAAALPDAVYVQGDISDPADAAGLVDTAIERFGRLDILVNNAGRTRFIPLGDLEAADAAAWRDIFDVNVIGTWQMITAALPHLKASGSGSIVNISSVSGTRAMGSSIPYAVSKAAVDHMTRLLAATLGPGIRVNAVAPGLVDTPWYDEAQEVWEGSRDWITANTPQRRVGTPQDVAEAVYTVAHAAYTTGAVLMVDGGRHLV